MWKVLLVISAVVLAGAAYLSWTNFEEKKVKVADLAVQMDTLEKRLADIARTEMEIAQLEQSIQMLNDEQETLETEKIDLDAKVVEAKSNLKAQEADLVAAEEKLTRAKALIADIAEIDILQKEMLQIRTQIEETEIELTQVEGATAAAQVERDRLEKVANEAEALRKDQQAGIIRGPFQSRVKKAYNKLGFVVVAGGSDQGVVNRAQLDVYRRGQPICRLIVTSLFGNECAADIVPGSLAPGQSVQVGDTVMKTVQARTPAVVPADGGAAPAEGGGPAAPAPADPFGGGGGMAPGGAAPDPFGGGGGAAPDPFGGGGGAMKDAGGGAPDPFGGGGGGAMEDAGGGAPDPFQ